MFLSSEVVRSVDIVYPLPAVIACKKNYCLKIMTDKVVLQRLKNDLVYFLG